MTIDKPEVIDIVTYDRTGAILLVMVEHRPWEGSPERLAQLRAKFDRYVAFVTDGELVERYPFAAGRPIHIELRSYEAPDDAAAHLLEQIRSQLATHGFTLVTKKLRSQAPL